MFSPATLASTTSLEGYRAGREDDPGTAMPSASIAEDMVLAVNMAEQVPAVVDNNNEVQR